MVTLGLEEKSLGDDEVVSLRRAACLPGDGLQMRKEEVGGCWLMMM